MRLPDWLRPRLLAVAAEPEGPVARPPARRPVRRDAPPRLETLWLDASDLSAAWRPGERRLFVPAPPRLDLSRPVEVRITSATGLDVLVLGTPQALRLDPAARWAVAEIDPGDEGAALVVRVLSRSKAGAPPVRQREARHRVALPVVVTSELGATVLMKTTTASRLGCGLAWNGPPPRLHSGVHLRVLFGRRAATLRGMVRWVGATPRGVRVGVRFVASTDDSWWQLLSEARQSESEALG